MTTHQQIMDITLPAFAESFSRAMAVLDNLGATDEELDVQAERLAIEWQDECKRVADELDAG